jgi:hypothetical protein
MDGTSVMAGGMAKTSDSTGAALSLTLPWSQSSDGALWQNWSLDSTTPANNGDLILTPLGNGSLSFIPLVLEGANQSNPTAPGLNGPGEAIPASPVPSAEQGGSLFPWLLGLPTVTPENRPSEDFQPLLPEQIRALDVIFSTEYAPPRQVVVPFEGANVPVEMSAPPGEGGSAEGIPAEVGAEG